MRLDKRGLGQVRFDELIDRPSSRTLDRILSGARLDLIAPFARSGPLLKLDPLHHRRIRIITRLPSDNESLPSKLENDPRHFLELSQRLGRSIQIFGLPGVHTKLYLNGREAFYGSANFTSFGFGMKPESLLVTTDRDTYTELDALFNRYLVQARRISTRHLSRLAALLTSGSVSYSATPEQPVELRRNPAADSEVAFRRWLARQAVPDAAYIEARFDPASGYNMTGHTQSAFPGIRTFLRQNLDLIPELAAQTYRQNVFWSSNEGVRLRLAEFVRVHGHQFPARGGGDWRRKLPPSLGGRPGPGGAPGGRGSGLIARMLLYLSLYAVEEGF